MKYILIIILSFPLFINAQTKVVKKNTSLTKDDVRLQANGLHLNFEVYLLSSGLVDINLSEVKIEDCLLNNLKSIVKNNYNKFENLYDNSKYFPVKQAGCDFIRECKSESGAPGWFFPGMFYSKVFNRLRYTSRQRALTVFDSYVINFFQSLYSNLEGVLPPSITIHVIYLNKDFTDSEEKYNYNAESMIVSTSVKSIKQLIDNNITDIQFMKGCNIYILPDTGNGFRKTTF